VQKKESKQPDLNDPDHIGVAHKSSGPVKHGAIILRVKNGEVIKNAGVQTNVNN
jgi:hypothetical protein